MGTKVIDTTNGQYISNRNHLNTIRDDIREAVFVHHRLPEDQQADYVATDLLLAEILKFCNEVLGKGIIPDD